MQRATFILACFFSLMIFGGINAFSQTSTHRHNFKHINVQSGLTQNIVYHFLQDSHGYMWIGTHNGLNLFDGTRTINFLPDEKTPGSIKGDFITSILEDKEGRIWIGNESGIDRYDRATHSFTHYGIDRPDGSKENNYCVALGFVSANELWILETKTRSVRSLHTITGKTSFIANINATHAQLFKGSGETVHIWSAYDKGTIHQVYKNSRLVSQLTYFDGKNGPVKTPAFEIIHILQQNDTTAWLSTNLGLVRLNPVTNTFRLYNQLQNREVKELRYSALSAGDQLWVASGPDGIYIFDTRANRFIENYRNDKLNPFSICSDNIVSLYFDKTGNIWCGSYGNGASYSHTGNKFFSSHVSKHDVKAWNGNNYIHWFGSDPAGNIWCTFDNIPGFLQLDKNLLIKKYSVPLYENGSAFNQSLYKLLFESPTKVWCTSNKGLYLYDSRTSRLRPVPYPLLSDEVQGSIWIKDILRLRDSSILFSTFSGLYRITKKNDQYAIAPIHFLQPGSYTGIGPLYQDENGLIYAKSLVDSFYILKPAPLEKDYRLIKALHFAPVINHYFSGKNDSLVFLATSDGLFQIHKENFSTEKLILNKIPFLQISRVFKKENRYWLFGEKGIYYFNSNNKESRTFTEEDGLPANEFTLSGLEITPDGRCIAGTSNGLVSFFYQQPPDTIYPARPQLTNIYINDTLYKTLRNPDETQKINLSYRQNTFSFDFSPVTFQHAAECSFEYRLDDYDEDWIKSGDIRYTRYSRIPPGRYVFNLRIVDPAGKISPHIKTMEILISKAWWQTIVFKIVVAAFIIFISWLLVKWYYSIQITRQKREHEKQQLVEKERTRIATDMHDDLGAGLSRIKFLSETIGIKKQQQQPIEEEIGKIREYSHEMIDKMGEIVWALNEKNDSLSDLLSYSRSYAVEYLSQSGIACQVRMPENYPSAFVSGEFRRNIYLSLKEALHNIVKHAQASRVDIVFQINHELSISIIDDGIGFDKTNIRPFSNGLANMEKRMKDIRGSIQIQHTRLKTPAAPQTGTTVKLTAPISV